MPFTVSHPAIVLPLKSLWPRYFSLSGLFAGAMSPDLIYFLLCHTEMRGFSHSWTGLFIFCLPAGVAFVLAFHWLVKRELILNLPKPFDRWLSGLAESKFRVSGGGAWSALVGSVLIGALSHFFWDSFTHAGGEIVKMLPALNTDITFMGITRSYSRWIQHASTIVGGLAVLGYLAKSKFIPRPTLTFRSRSSKVKLSFWLFAATVAVIVTMAALLFYDEYYEYGIFDFRSPTMTTIIVGLGSWAGIFWASLIMGATRLTQSQATEKIVDRAAS